MSRNFIADALPSPLIPSTSTGRVSFRCNPTGPASFDTYAANRGMIMKLLYLFLTVSFFSVACQAQRTALPAEVPADLSFDYRLGGGMNRSYREFSTENGVLAYEE